MPLEAPEYVRWWYGLDMSSWLDCRPIRGGGGPSGVEGCER